MISSTLINKPLNSYCKYDIKCQGSATNHCQRCGQIYCLEHYLKHQRNLQEYFEYMLNIHNSLQQKFKSLMSQLSTNVLSDLEEQIKEFEMKSEEIKKAINRIQPQLHDLSNHDECHKENQSILMTNGLKDDGINCLEIDIEHLGKDIEELQLKFVEINNTSQIQTLENEELSIQDKNNQLEKMKSSNIINNNTILSNSSIEQISSCKFESNHTESESSQEDENDQIGMIASKTTPRLTRKIRLSGNFVSWLRGPFRLVIDAPIRVAELCTRGTHADKTVIQAVKKGLMRQKEMINNLPKPVFDEITSDWIYEGENSDRGFNSVSIWMRNPSGQRILAKIEDLPICAANEWLAYALGKQLGLLVNEVQIAIYENDLVTLHTDVALENEKTISFIDLPKKIRNILLTDPTMECMDLFDHILQNVDRNSRNILITIQNTMIHWDDITKLKVHLIDHSSSFGMGKLNVISAVACKFHTEQLAVIKFDPIDEAKTFENYLNKLPMGDRLLVRQTLNRFAAITDEQIDNWMNEVKDLLTPSQFSRIHDVLYRKRDIVRYYMKQWDITSISSNEQDSSSSETL